MKFIQIFFVALVAFEHIYFMILEMFFWTKPKGLKAFGMKLEEAETSKTLAKNQGLYNGFLAAGLLWAIFNKEQFEPLALFFLSCVVIAGIYGAVTTKKVKLFYIQSVPAIAGILTIII